MTLPRPISFTVPGHPHGKGRPRVAVRNGFARQYTPKETANYEGMVRLAAQAAMNGRPPTDRPVAVTIAAIFDIPKSATKRFREDALIGTVFPAKKPDISNIAKAIEDGMNAIVFKDDSQIVSLTTGKRYGATPEVRVTVRSL